MSITLTASYREMLHEDAVAKIDELLEENYALEDMLEFIDERNETNFVLFYEEYVRVGEAIGYEAVDALIEEMGCVADIEDCDDRYMGMYDSTADFAQETVESCYGDIPSIVVVDWEATWDSSLRYDYTACEVGYRQVYIFRDH
jgi:antirestriction protein